MSALLKKLSEVAQVATKKTPLELIPGGKIVPIPDRGETKTTETKGLQTLGLRALILAVSVVALLYALQSTDQLSPSSPSPRTPSASPATTKLTSAEATSAYLRRDFDTAEKGFQSLMQAAPEQAAAAINLALVYKAKGEQDASLRLYETIIKKFPFEPVALNNLGVLEMELGLLSKAEFHLNLALKTRPEYKEAFLNLAQFYERNGKWSNALELYEEYLQTGKKDAALTGKIRERIRKISSLSSKKANEGPRL